MMNTNQTDCKKLNLNPAVLKKAVDGDAIAQVTLGKAYFHAVHFENNCLSAFEWFSRSAEQDNMEAQFLLANLYTLGQGTKKNHIEAYKWYIKAALQGYKKAAIRLHNLYQQDKKLLCRGKINSEEALKVKEAAFRSVTHYHKELNEQRLEDYKNKFSDTIINYTGQFNEHKYDNHDDSDKQLNLGFLYQYGYGVKRSILLAFEYYEKAAEKGHRDAQYHLAVLYQRNTNIKFNYRKALRWYRASATNGNIAAQNNLAYFYEKGLSIDLNYEGAVYWYTEAANNGNPDAQLNLGRLYRKGQGVEQSFLEAAKWYKLAALQGNITAQNCLNQLFQNRKLGAHLDTKNLAECEGDRFSSTTALRSKLQNDINRLSCSPRIQILTKISQHALRTDGNAMYTIGLKYYKGEDFPQDKDTGFQWIKKAAKAGNQEAETKIAKMYEDGDTVEQDYHESSIWTMKLVKKKNAEAQCKLGILYKNGLGVRKDPLEASKWFILASDQENRDALYQFGLLKFDGEGVRQDSEEDFKYFYKSALLGQPDALFRLGYMYESGQYVEKDKPKAVQMYEYAAKLGYVHAQFRLGRIYEEGSLTQKDLVKALKYYTMATDSGEPSYRNELAIKYLNGVFDGPNFTKAYDLIKQAPKKESLIEGTIFNKPVIHFTEIDEVSKIIDMLVTAIQLGAEHVAYEIGYIYEFGLYYGCSIRKIDETEKMEWYHLVDLIREKNQLTKPLNSKALKWYSSGNEKTICNQQSGSSYRTLTSYLKSVYCDYNNSIKWYSVAASRGDSRAYYHLGVMHEYGKGVAKNLKAAFDYYFQAYKNGDSNSAYSLALMYQKGKGVSQDLIKAFYLFSEASCMGNKDASEMLVASRENGNLEMLETVANLGFVAIQYQLGVYYEKEDYIKSFKWFSMAAQGEITDAYYRLGLFYEDGRGVHINFLKAIELYEKASRKEHKDALYRLAQFYHHGQIIECDYLKAYDFYTKAAKLEHKDAQKILDTTEKLVVQPYEKNQKGALDVSSSEINDSLALLKSVAEYGDIELQYSLGVFYFRDGKKQDYEEAFLWFKMAADNNHVESIFHLGLLYERGLGVEQDYSTSFDLYNRAKMQGNHYALYRLGVAFHHGYGVNRNVEEALCCYTKAAEVGNHESQYTLGVLYKEGSLVQKDTLRRLVWLTKAYQNGNFNAVDDLFDLYIDQPYEQYFHQKLFQILSKYEKTHESISLDYRDTHNLLRLKRGKMHFYGLGATKSYTAALKYFLKVKNSIHRKHVRPFLPLENDNNNFLLKENYMEVLKAYSSITDELNEKQLYQLGMPYHDGAEIYSIDQNTANISGPIAIVRKDKEMTFQYIKLASEKGSAEAQNHLGQMYLEGKDIPQDYHEAIRLCTIAAESMTPYSCYQKGMTYYNEIKVDKSLEISLIYLKKAAEKNHAPALAQLIKVSLQDDCVEKNNENTIKEIQDSVKLMTPNDCYLTGMELYTSIEVDKNYEISLIYLQSAANNDHPEAQAQLGEMYLQGNGVDKNFEKARVLIEQSLVDLDPQKCYKQGMKFYEGTKVDKNYGIALIYLRKAAEKHYGLALAQLGVMYFQGDGVEKNLGKAVKYTEQAIIEMTGKECYDQGMKLYKKFEVDINYELSLKYLRSAASKGHGEALAQIGLMYLQGNGVEKSRAEAILWTKQVVKKLNTINYYQQGMIFYKSAEVEEDYEISLICIKKAAEDYYGALDISSQIYVEKQALAQAQLGLMHLRGDGVEKNYKKAMDLIKNSVENMRAFDCYLKGMEFYRTITIDRNYDIALLFLKEAALLFLKEAAKKGDPYSQVQLAYMYSKGMGVDKDHEQATRWRNRIRYGYPKHDTFSLAQIYHYDEGGIQDFSKALECYQKGLNDSFSRLASRGIGMLYEYGDGVNQDYKKAMEHYKKAVDAGNTISYYNIGLLYYYGRGVDQSYIDALGWFTACVERSPENPVLYEIQYVFIQDDSNDILDFAGYKENKYSLQLESIFFGAAHYYLGLMHRNGYGTVQNNDKAKVHFRRSLTYGIKRAKDFIIQ